MQYTSSVQKFGSLTNVQNWLDKEMSGNINVLEKTRDCLEPISRMGNMIPILESILQNEKLLFEIGKKSYTHDNGFDKFLLIDRNNYRFRLHIWWPEHTVEHIENAHNHPWDFSSRVLTGSLRFQTFSIGENDSENPRDEQLHRYFIEATPNGHTVTFKGLQKLNWVFDGTLESGSFYSLSKEVIHRVIKDNQSLTSTVVLQEGLGRGQSNIFTVTPQIDDDRVCNDYFDIDTVASKLKRYLQYIKNQQVILE